MSKLVRQYMNQYDYAIHPLAKLFPDLSLVEFEKLKADIEKNGQQETIVLSNDRKVVLDGRHRLKACKELDIEPDTMKFEQLGLGYLGTEAEFIWSKNVLRRHLTDDQRAAIALRWSDTEKAAAKQRQREHGGTAPGRPQNTSGESAQSVRTRTAIAKKVGVSEHKIQQAERVAAKAPELLEKVASGAMKLKDAEKTTQVKTKPKSAADAVLATMKNHPDQVIDVPGDAFNEQAVLVRLYHDWEVMLNASWPKNRDLTPVIRKVYAFAVYLEGVQRVRAAELQKKVDAIGL